MGVHSCTKYAERRSLQSFAGPGNFEFYSHALLRGSSFYNTNFRKDHYNQMLHQYCTSPTRDTRLRESANSADVNCARPNAGDTVQRR